MSATSLDSFKSRKTLKVGSKSYTYFSLKAAEKNGQAQELLDQLLELASEHNKDTGGGTSIRATFLRVTVSL